MDEAMELIKYLNKEQHRIMNALRNARDYDERRRLEKLTDSIERAKEDIRRNCLR